MRVEGGCYHSWPRHDFLAIIGIIAVFVISVMIVTIVIVVVLVGSIVCLLVFHYGGIHVNHAIVMMMLVVGVA